MDARIFDVLFDEVWFYLVMALLLVFFAVMEWWRSYFQTPPYPVLASIIAAVSVAFAAYRIRRGMKRINHLKLGRDGERVVGQFLERLRAKGAQVLHDFPADGFNIDHVVVHASGVYAIETKTFSKPDRGESKILFDGESVEIFGKKPERNPVTQARACATWLKELISESTGKQLPVRPVVVFPGWFIVPTAEAKRSDVWVLNPKALPAFIEHSDNQIAEPDVRMVTTHLSIYARNALAKKG